MINIWYLILFFCLMPSLVYAQAKPKRDTSKDKSVILLKKQKEETGRKVIPVERKANYRKVLVAKQSKRKASNKRRHTAARKYSASYLTVNRQSLSLSSILAQNGGRLTFDVNTEQTYISTKDNTIRFYNGKNNTITSDYLMRKIEFSVSGTSYLSTTDENWNTVTEKLVFESKDGAKSFKFKSKK